MIMQILTLLLPVPLGTQEHDLACLAMEWMSFFSLTHRAFGGLAVAFFKEDHCMGWALILRGGGTSYEGGHRF